MAGPNLPTNVDASNADSSVDLTVKTHQQHHDVLHAFANRYDVEVMPGDGQVLTFDGATQLYKPKTPSSTGGTTDLTGTPLVVSAAGGGTGAYPARPATARPVTFRGVAQPNTDGSTAGGGGMILGTDQWLYWSSADVSGVGAGAVTTPKVADGAVTLAKLGSGVLVAGKIDPALLPALAITEFLGTVSTQAAMLALVGQRGDWCIRTDGANAGTWVLTVDAPTQLSSWVQYASATSGVASVNGKTGSAVTIGASDLADLSTVLDAYLASTLTPRELYAASGGTGAYAVRPATSRPIHFYGSNPPAANGSVLGGGGMVPNLDQWFDWTAQ